VFNGVHQAEFIVRLDAAIAQLHDDWIFYSFRRVFYLRTCQAKAMVCDRLPVD
jgi:hypothetical protein